MQLKYPGTIFTAVLLLITFQSFAQKNCTLRVNVKNILINKGNFYIALYNAEKGFLKTPCSKIQLPASRITNGVVFSRLPAGEYAVTIFQDLNNNKALDKMMSVPVEPYGLSNNVSAYPTYANTKFLVADKATITVNLRN
jgi:uncharacterized protein (DUF2141 family)